MVYKYDFLIIGAGVAGMSYALKVAREKKGSVCLICKTSLDEANTSFAQKMRAAGKQMGTAGLNTLLGMGSVFIVLILICLIISTFTLLNKKDKKKPETNKPVNNPTPAPVEEELSDDTELVAVITAAICAYEGAGSSDGFVVRSIRKVNRRR